MNEDYRRGYRDGVEDALRRQQQAPQPPSSHKCPACSMEFLPGVAYGYYCQRPNCPSGLGPHNIYNTVRRGKA